MDKPKTDMANTTEMDIYLNAISTSKENIQCTRTARNMMFLSVSLYSAFFCLGLVSSLTAPAFLHLVELYNTDVSQMSVMFTFTSTGYLVGSSTCAFLFDRANHELQYFLLSVLEAGLTVLIPLLPGVYILYTVAFLQNIAMAYIDASGQSYIIRLWSNHKLKEPLLLGMHAVWSVGAFTGPFLVSPFLADLPKGLESSSQFNGTTEYNISTIENVTVFEDEDIFSFDEIKYPYIITGCVVTVSSLFFLVSYFFCKDQGRLTRSKTMNDYHGQKSGEVLSFKIPMLVMQFLFFFLYTWYVYIPGSLLSTFVIEGLNWSIYDGPLLMSVYWGSQGIGRIVNIPISFCMKPLMMLCINMIICVVAHIIMFTAVLTIDKLLWISTAMSGFSMGTLFSFGILWVSEYMHISGAMGAFFLIVISIGGMTGPPLAGYLFEYSSHMWIIYLSCIASVVQAIVFLLMLVFVRIHKKWTNNKKVIELEGEREPMHSIGYSSVLP